MLSKKIFLMTILGILMGVWTGMQYRHSIGLPQFSKPVFFLLPAALIGIGEEIIFRGILSRLLEKSNTITRILFTSTAHAGYKTVLFLSPFSFNHIDTRELFLFTFLAGIIMGVMREYSKSVIPTAAAHAGWDITVYGDSPITPWWIL